MLCILPRHQVSSNTGKVRLSLEGYPPFCPSVLSLPFFRQPANLHAFSVSGGTFGWAEMESVLDTLCFGNFLCVYFSQKPESIKAIMLGGPDRGEVEHFRDSARWGKECLEPGKLAEPGCGLYRWPLSPYLDPSAISERKCGEETVHSKAGGTLGDQKLQSQWAWRDRGGPGQCAVCSQTGDYVSGPRPRDPCAPLGGLGLKKD